MTKFQLHILGCGSATNNLQHRPSCQVLDIRDNLFMIDCGEGAQLEMRRNKLKFSRLNHIFISHLHGDHCFGLPGLLSTMALLGKTGTITIHTFADGARILQELMDYFCRDIPFELKYNIIEGPNQVIYEDEAITVTTLPLRHRIPAVGFLFAEKPKARHIIGEKVKFFGVPHYKMNEIKMGADFIMPNGTVIPNSHLTTEADRPISYAYCSDTRYAEKVVEAVRGVDWLYHEATYGDDFAKMARQYYHSTAREAGIAAREAGAKRLIIGHYSKRYTDESLLLAQAQEEFPHAIAAKEGMTIDLNDVE